MNMKNRKRQSGITLITSLMMLLAMTIIGVTAMRLSTIDLLVANNYQQQLSVYQEAETKIRRDVSFFRLREWMMEDQQPPVTARNEVTANAKVIDLRRNYPCKGQSNLANSLGPDSPSCRLYMFAIDANLKGSGAKEKHYQGSGKQFPSQANGSYGQQTVIVNP